MCENGTVLPMEDANGIVLEALLDDVVTPEMIDEAVKEALSAVESDQGADDRRQVLEAELGRVERERARLAAAVASGGDLSPLLEALKTREREYASLKSELALLAARDDVRSLDGPRIQRELQTLANEWRRVLADDPKNARPIATKLRPQRESHLCGSRKYRAKRGWRRRLKSFRPSTILSRNTFARVPKPHTVIYHRRWTHPGLEALSTPGCRLWSQFCY